MLNFGFGNVVLRLAWGSLKVDIAFSEFEILIRVLSNETRLDGGERDDGCVDEGGIESGVERKMQVALSSGPGQEQGDIHVLLVNVSVLDDLLVLRLSFRSFNFENRIP